jgi:hypothetical protein
MKLKRFTQFITESRDETEEQMGDYGLGPSTFTWDVKYDDDMQNMERSDRQSMYDYESPTGAHVTKAEGVIEAFQTQLDIYFSNEDKIQMHIKFAHHPGDKGRAAFQVRHAGYWKNLFNVWDNEAEEWLDKVEELGSPVKPIFYYYEKFLAGLNSTTLTEMITSDSTKLKLFVRALRDLPIDSSEIFKIRELINTRSIDPYNDRLSILDEVDRVFSDIPGLSNLVQKFSRPLN